jgi:SPP1 gp7 family putative phage head morphogenesis protein
MVASTKEQEQVTRGQEPIFREILDSDTIYGYSSFAYNTADLNMANPTEVWTQMMWDPWLAMTVYQDMEEKDDCIASSLDTRKDGVLALSRRVLPAGKTRQDIKIAEFVEETLEGRFTRNGDRYSGMNQILYELLDAVGKGVSIGEIIFGDGRDHVYIEDVKFKPQHLFSFADGPMAALSTPSYLGLQTGPLRLRYPYLFKDLPADGLLPQGKFIVGTYRPRYSNRWGSPQDRKVFWPSWFKRASMKQWLRYLEKGSGSVVSRYNDGAGTDERKKALDAARAVNEESAVAIPTKFHIEVLEHVRQSMGNAFEGMVDGVCNNSIMRVILGQTLTSRGSEGGGSQALGNVHNEVRSEKKEADAKFLMGVVNRSMVAPIVLFKFGPYARLPLWTIDYDQKRDLSADSIIHQRLRGIGLPMAKSFFYTNYQIPEPGDGEELLEAPQNAKTPGTPSTGVDSAADFAEQKKNAIVRKAIEDAVKLEDSVLQLAAPLYEQMFRLVIEAVSSNQWEASHFDNNFFEFLNNTFKELAGVLADGLLASYLLAVYQVEIETERGTTSFADPIQLGFDVAPQEAIDYFKGKKVVTRKAFDLLSEDARSAAFTVSGIYKNDVLEGFKSEISKALEEGTPQKQVIKRFREIVSGAYKSKELGAFHLETIWRTNMAMSYGVGRRRALEEVADDLPFWEYNDVGDDRVRERHHALNRIILPANHEFWNDHFPPWDFNCRCSVTATDQIPDGYDHSSPAGESDVKLYYDDRGMPAKAEIGTSVYDLAAAGDFQGVPPQGGLKAAIEAGVQRARNSKNKR